MIPRTVPPVAQFDAIFARVPSPQIEVWDLPVRVGHWTLVALTAFSWWAGDEGGLTRRYHM